ncbi:hypothetical protein [Sphingomonas soli]|uniref:hypothetical protein n=1 Tax=Sphingomonas soli TaxID=266127 RepID=UPI0012ED83C9|nr:hypothetical protein [Sphingomonas soli]
MASVASVAHFEHGVKVVSETPLPSPVTEAFAAVHPDHWGQLVGLGNTILVNIAYQVGSGVVHYPVTTVAVIWWFLETAHLAHILYKAVRKWLKRGHGPTTAKAPPIKGGAAKRRTQPLRSKARAATPKKPKPQKQEVPLLMVPQSHKAVPASDVDPDIIGEAGEVDG